jgi:hypothetical protein
MPLGREVEWAGTYGEIHVAQILDPSLKHHLVVEVQVGQSFPAHTKKTSERYDIEPV